MRGGRHILADEVCTDRQFAVAAVDEDCELDGLRAAHVDDGIERCADRAARVEHVVDEHDCLARDVDRQFRLMNDWLIRERREVIAIERDVEDTDWRLLALDMLDIGSDALRNRHAARADAHDDDVVDALVALDDLMRDARQGAANPLGIHDDGLVGQYWHKNPSQTQSVDRYDCKARYTLAAAKHAISAGT